SIASQRGSSTAIRAAGCAGRGGRPPTSRPRRRTKRRDIGAGHATPRTGRTAMTFEYPDRYDVIVVGAGHAGCEAALAAARMGARVLVLTGNLDMVAQMSCNPAIGGVAKGHLVKELDALGGEMAGVIDETGIQFRRLNASKGPAVRSTRAQADKRRYRDEMRMRLERCDRLALRQGEVAQLHVDDVATTVSAEGSSTPKQIVGVTTTMG